MVKGINDKKRRLNRRGVVKLFKKQKFVYITGVVEDNKGNKIPDANIELQSGFIKSISKSNKHGFFKIYAPLDADAIITADAKNYFYKTVYVKRRDLLSPRKIKIVVPKVKPGEKYIAKNLLFYGSRSNLRQSSLDELRHLEHSIKLNDNLCFEIAGHINGPNKPNSKPGTFDYELSVARALTIYDSLVNYGIDKERLLAKGYGNWFMIYPKTRKEAQMRFNRRVEIVVKDCSTIKNGKNDVLSKDFVFSVYDEHFSPGRLKICLDILPNKQKTKVLKTLKTLKSKGLDPTTYTYGELLNYK